MSGTDVHDTKIQRNLAVPHSAEQKKTVCPGAQADNTQHFHLLLMTLLEAALLQVMFLLKSIGTPSEHAVGDLHKNNHLGQVQHGPGKYKGPCTPVTGLHMHPVT